MTNFQFLRAYLALQKDIMFDELLELGFGTLCFNKIDPSPFWNNILIEKALTKQEIQTAENELSQRTRKSALFFENNHSMQAFTTTLADLGYEKAAEDSLMFHEGTNISDARFDQIRKVTTSDELEIFMKTFDACYRADDPLNPYGELGEYVFTAKIAWEKHHKSNRIEYFIAFKEDAPVAVAALTNFNGVGYLSNIGTLVSVRGQGFGKVITNYCLAQSVKNGNQTHFLATEEGTNPNSFYKAVGFKTKFTAKLMVMN